MSETAPLGTEPVVVFVDPTSRPDYVREFVGAFWGKWGIRSVLLYPRESSRPHIARADGVIGDSGVAARYRGDLSDLEGAARQLRERFSVLAAVPQSEAVVLQAARLGELTGTQGMPMSTAGLFRDKYGLKQLLRTLPSGPRVNHSAKVSSVPQVRSFVERYEISDFVLKPNDGSGNSNVSFFSADCSDADLQSYLTANPAADVLCEELIRGDEYCVNGQVGENGDVIVYSVQRAEHQHANGRNNLAVNYGMVASDTKEFGGASSYAEQVLTAAGMRSSPFHMEIKIGPDGPCLIEVAARIGGAGIPWDTNLAHHGRVNLFTEAARAYARLPGQPVQPDWSAYDDQVILSILGLAVRDERVIRLCGVRAVERLPQFAYWVRPPELGQHVSRTTDLTSSPWQVTLRGSSAPEVREAARRTRELIGWNQGCSPSSGMTQRVRARAAWLRRRMPMVGPLLTGGPVRLPDG